MLRQRGPPTDGALCFCAKKRLREVTSLPGKIFSAARAIYTSSALPSREKTLAPHDATALTEKTFLDSAARLRYTLPLREKTLAPHDEHDIFRKGQARLEGPALPEKTFLCGAGEKTLLPREEYNIFYGSPCTERASLKASFAAIGCPQSVREILSVKDTEFRVDSHGRFPEKNASTHVLRIRQ